MSRGKFEYLSFVYKEHFLTTYTIIYVNKLRFINDLLFISFEWYFNVAICIIGVFQCRAELSTIKMLDRHVQSRHPNSIHRYQDDNTNAKPWNKSHSNETASQQRLKLNPLKSPISSGRTTCGSMNISNTSTCMLTKNHQEPSKIVALSPVVDRRTLAHQDDKVTTATNTTSGRSTATDSINNMCQPLTVVIYSPNSEQRGNDRFVRISPLSTDDRQNDTDEKRLGNANGHTNNVIELFDSPCQDSAAVITVDEATRRNESRSFCTAGPPPYKKVS